MRLTRALVLLFVASTQVGSRSEPINRFWLDQLDVSTVSQEWRQARSRLSVDGRPIRLHGITCPHGVGTHARSEWRVVLNGGAKSFDCLAGIDDECRTYGSARFEVWADGRLKVRTPVQRGGGEPAHICTGLLGVRCLTLIVTDAGDGKMFDHADWGNAAVNMLGGAPSPRPLRQGDGLPSVRHGSSGRPRGGFIYWLLPTLLAVALVILGVVLCQSLIRPYPEASRRQ